MNIPDQLLRGYHAFRAGRFKEQSELYRSLSQGQQPSTMIIGCADSRVDPATIFSAAPGELFVMRNVAALVPPCEETGSYHGTSAAIEFAVVSLKVRNIVVLGHGLCGGVAASLAAAESQPLGRFIGPWVELLAGSRDQLLMGDVQLSREQLHKSLEHRAVQQSLENLMSFPFVAQSVAAGTLRLEGAWFSIAEAELQWLDRGTGTFAPVPDGIS